MEKINNVNFLKGDFTDLKILEKIAVYFNNTTDAVLSDIAINTTGNKSLDSYRTGVLCLASMDLAIKILSKNGIFLSWIVMAFAAAQQSNSMHVQRASRTTLTMIWEATVQHTQELCVGIGASHGQTNTRQHTDNNNAIVYIYIINKI